MVDLIKCYELKCSKKAEFYCECIPSKTFMCPHHIDNHRRPPHHIQYIVFSEIGLEIKELTVKMLCEEIEKIIQIKKESIEAFTQWFFAEKNLFDNIIQVLDRNLHEIETQLEKVIATNEVSQFEKDQLLKSLLAQDVSEIKKICLIDEKIFANINIINKYTNETQEIIKKLNIDKLEDIARNDYEGFISHYLRDNLINNYQQNPLTCELEKLENTIMSWNEDFKNYPKTRSSWFFKWGIIEFLAGNMYMALSLFNFAIKLNPNYYDCYFYKGLALFNLNRKEELFECWDHLIQQNRRLSFLNIIKARMLYYLNRNTESLKLYDGFIQNSSDNHFVNVLKQESLQVEKKYKEMNICYDEMISINSNFSIACSYKGQAFHALHQYEAALEQFYKAIIHDNKCYFAYIGIGITINSQRGYDEESLLNFNTAIEINPYHATGHSNKGLNLIKLNRMEQALECFKEAARLDPSLSTAYYGVGLYYHNQKEYQQAIKYYDQAILYDPSNEEFKRKKNEAEARTIKKWYQW